MDQPSETIWCIARRRTCSSSAIFTIAARIGVERASKVNGGRHGVRRRPWLELLEEPDSLLPERERRRTLARDDRQGHIGRRHAGERVDARREPREDGGFEHGAKRQVDVE